MVSRTEVPATHHTQPQKHNYPTSQVSTLPSRKLILVIKVATVGELKNDYIPHECKNVGYNVIMGKTPQVSILHEYIIALSPGPFLAFQFCTLKATLKKLGEARRL